MHMHDRTRHLLYALYLGLTLSIVIVAEVAVISQVREEAAQRPHTYEVIARPTEGGMIQQIRLPSGSSVQYIVSAEPLSLPTNDETRALRPLVENRPTHDVFDPDLSDSTHNYHPSVPAIDSTRLPSGTGIHR
jgi:hypothetical protein